MKKRYYAQMTQGRETEMKTKTQEVLPKTIAGTVHKQFVRCGKPNCKCSRGELHGAYYYHFVRVGGRLRKRYLKASEIDETHEACFRRRREEKTRRLKTKTAWNQIRELRSSLRELRELYALREK